LTSDTAASIKGKQEANNNTVRSMEDSDTVRSGQARNNEKNISGGKYLKHGSW